MVCLNELVGGWVGGREGRTEHGVGGEGGGQVASRGRGVDDEEEDEAVAHEAAKGRGEAGHPVRDNHLGGGGWVGGRVGGWEGRGERGVLNELLWYMVEEEKAV